jgi:hypothetical protein
MKRPVLRSISSASQHHFAPAVNVSSQRWNEQISAAKVERNTHQFRCVARSDAQQFCRPNAALIHNAQCMRNAAAPVSAAQSSASTSRHVNGVSTVELEHAATHNDTQHSAASVQHQYHEVRATSIRYIARSGA